jgi:RimJ/RimL family protein N-acetyltransferase
MPLAKQFITEAEEWSPRSYPPTFNPADILSAPNCVWLTALEAKEVIGIVGFTGISWEDGCADLALGVVPKWRGHGKGVELARLQNAYGFETLGLTRLQMIALEGSPSCKIAQANGLSLEGSLKACRLKAGKRVNASVYALVREV